MTEFPFTHGDAVERDRKVMRDEIFNDYQSKQQQDTQSRALQLSGRQSETQDEDLQHELRFYPQGGDR